MMHLWSQQEAKNRRRGVRTIAPMMILLGLLVVSLSPRVEAQGAGKWRRWAQKALREGNYKRAEEFYRRLLARNHRDHRARLGLSYTLIKQGRMKEAFQHAALVAGQDPLNARAHALLGMALLRSGVFQKAIEEFTTALILNRREAMALAGLAEIDFFENRTQQAYERLRAATALNPSEPDYWIAFGRAAARLERFKEAAEHYQRFLSISPRLDKEKRERYRGLIDFYFALARLNVSHLHRVEGPRTMTLPFELKNSRPFIPVRINGSDPLVFVVDTGASITVLSERVARALGIRAIARGGRARAVGGGGTFPIVYGLVNELDIGDIRVYNVPIYIRPFRHFQREGNAFRADGFLGLSVLSNFKLTLDYARRELTLDRSAGGRQPADVPPEVTVVPFRTTNGGLVSVEVKLDGREECNFILDSGASTTVLAEETLERLDWQDKIVPDLRVRVLGAAGVLDDVHLLILPSLTISNLEQRNVRTPILNMDAVNEAAGFAQSGIIGGHFLKHFRVTFDFPRFRVLLRPQTEAVRRIPVPPSEQNEN